MANKKAIALKLFLILCLLFILALSAYIYKNTYDGINLQGQKTKIFYFNNTTYDIYRLELFSGEFINQYSNDNIKRDLKVRNGKLNGIATFIDFLKY